MEGAEAVEGAEAEAARPTVSALESPTSLARPKAATSPSTHGRQTAANQSGGLAEIGSPDDELAKQPSPISATPDSCPAALILPRHDGMRAPTHSPSPTAQTTLTTESSRMFQSIDTSLP